MKIREIGILVLSCCCFPITADPEPIQVGADQVMDHPYFELLRGKRIGIITNQTGVNSKLKSTIKILSHHPELEVVAIFSPEHGLMGQIQAGEPISSQGKVYSLYGRNRAPTSQMLAKIDVLLYDIQDVGVRFYTYISTLYLSLHAAAKHQIPLIVLDRPDPTGGSQIEGPVLQEKYKSFVGIEKLPIRYGMTPGELAQMFNVEKNLNCNLKIIPLLGWKRGQWYDQTGMQWIPPSPNMPTLKTASVYAGFCLIEGTNISEGRGTKHPFEFIGAPWLDNKKLVNRLNKHRLSGVNFRLQTFTPSFSKYKDELCLGVQIHVLDRDSFKPTEAVLFFLSEVLKLHPRKITFHRKKFDALAGNSWIREALRHNHPVKTIVARWQHSLEKFKDRRAKYLLYD